MALSEQELRLLEQMERALVEEDPKFANTLRGTAFRRSARRRAIVAGLIFVVGIAVLMTGAVLSRTVVGIVGFVIMLGAATVGLTALRGHSGHGGQGGQAAQQPSAGAAADGLSLVQGGRSGRRRPKPRSRSRSHGSFMERMEERWRRRREGGGF